MSASTQQIEVIESGLISVRQRAESIVVKTQADYIAVCNIVVEGRGFIKRWKEVFAPGIRSAKEHLDLLRNQEKEKVLGAESIVAIAEQKAEAWKREERLAAQREQDEINRKAREAQDKENQRLADEARRLKKKIPEPIAAPVQTVVVAPAVPKVAGIKARVNYKFEVIDASKVARHFLTPDLIAIGQVVRFDKDCEKSMKEIGGIRVWQEDSI